MNKPVLFNKSRNNRWEVVSKRALLGFFIILLSVTQVVLENSFGVVGGDLSVSLSSVGWLLFLFYIYKFYQTDYRYVSSSFYQLFYYFGVMVSATLIASGAYMYEIQKYGRPNGVFWICLIYAVVGFEFSYIGYKSIKKNETGCGGRFLLLLNKLFSKTLIGSTLILSSFILIRYGSPLAYSVTRVNYWGQIAPSYFSFVRVLLVVSFFLVVSIFAQKKISNKRTFLQALVVILYIFFAFVLLGEKFSFMIIYIMIWFLVISGLFDKGFVSKTYILIGIVLSILMIYVGFVYVGMGLGYEFIVNRIALQGQVLWSVLEESWIVLIKGAELNCSADCLFKIDGRDLLASRYLPASTYELNQETGTSLSGFMPSLSIFALGVPASIFLHIIFSIYLGRIQHQTLVEIASQKFILSFFYFCIYFFSLILWFVGNANLISAILFSHFFIFLYRKLGL